MRKIFMAAGLIAVLAIPSVTNAATRCEKKQAARKTTGTVLGAIAGAAVGSAVAGNRGHKESGAIIGGVAGAVAGNQLARQNNVCGPDEVAYDDFDNYPGEREFYDKHHYHSDGYLKFEEDRRRQAQAAEANAQNSAYAPQTWVDSSGRTCAWRNQSYRDDYGNLAYRWVQDCH